MEHEFSFGAIIKEQDPRDYNLGAALQEDTIPAQFFPEGWDTTIKENQGRQPACGAHAGAGALSYLIGSRRSPRHLWKNIKDIDGFDIESGTDLNSILKAMRDKGVCSFELTGNQVSLDLESYRRMLVTPEIEEDGNNNKIKVFATLYHPTFEQMKRAICKYKAIIILMRVGKNTYCRKDGTVSYKEEDLLPLSPTNFPLDGGHFVFGNAFSEADLFWPQSWGEFWGRKGIGYFREDYVPHVVAIGTFIPKEHVTPAVLPKYNFTQDLTVGSTGDDVKALQKRLEAEGCLVMPKGVAYGYFGPLTEQAVKKFQTKYAIKPVSGYVGPITRSVLNK